jgi:GH43 family beta-xylosidase
MPLKYRNPVWRGYFADPFVLQVGEEYFAYGTGGPENHGRQPDGRIFPLLRSQRLVDWEHLGGALTPLNDPGTPSYWAPAVAERDGRFYLYYSAGGFAGEGHQLRAATSESPAGPFTDSGRILLPDEPFSIDPHPFRDPKDGRWYLFFAKDYLDGPRCGTGLAAAELANDMLLVKGPVTPIYRARWDWQIFERNRSWYGQVWEAWHTVEGPCVLEREGRYYCLYSGGRWETPQYGIGFCAADSVLGPYGEDVGSEGPSVLKEIPGKVLGPGHNTVVKGPDGAADFIVYHAWDAEHTARRIFIDPLVWTPNGPVCDGPTFGDRVVG